jgi:hypothetical protein
VNAAFPASPAALTPRIASASRRVVHEHRQDPRPEPLEEVAVGVALRRDRDEVVEQARPDERAGHGGGRHRVVGHQRVPVRPAHVPLPRAVVARGGDDPVEQRFWHHVTTFAHERTRRPCTPAGRHTTPRPSRPNGLPLHRSRDARPAGRTDGPTPVARRRAPDPGPLDRGHGPTRTGPNPGARRPEASAPSPAACMCGRASDGRRTAVGRRQFTFA